VKYQFKENPKMLKTMKEATKENKNDIADGAAKRGGQEGWPVCSLHKKFRFFLAADRPKQN